MASYHHPLNIGVVSVLSAPNRKLPIIFRFSILKLGFSHLR